MKDLVYPSYICAIWDRKKGPNGGYNDRVMCFSSPQAAVRDAQESFLQGLKEKADIAVLKHPEDYELHHIGTMDLVTGDIVAPPSGSAECLVRFGEISVSKVVKDVDKPSKGDTLTTA